MPAARSVPIALPLPRLGVIGLAGPAGQGRALARWLVAQAAALHSPRDLRIVVLAASPQAGAEWNLQQDIFKHPFMHPFREWKQGRFDIIVNPAKTFRC